MNRVSSFTIDTMDGRGKPALITVWEDGDIDIHQQFGVWLTKTQIEELVRIYQQVTQEQQ